MKHIRHFVFAALMLILVSPVWAYGFEVDGIYYNASSTLLNAEVTYNSTYSPGSYFGNVVIPVSVSYGGNTYTVTGIGSYAFCECIDLNSITIPSSVVSIGDYAFSGCSGMASIVVETGNPIFDSRDNCNAIIETQTNTLIVGCNMTVIPNSVTGIGYEAFNRCTGLNSITIGNTVTTIGDFAFFGCTGLTSVIIPKSVMSMGLNPFYQCSSLTSIVVAIDNPYYDSRENCNAIIETITNELVSP